MFDAVHVVVSAVRELNRSQEIGVKPLACTSANIWPHGTSLMNYLRMVSGERGGPRGQGRRSQAGTLTVSTLWPLCPLPRYQPHPPPAVSGPLPPPLLHRSPLDLPLPVCTALPLHLCPISFLLLACCLSRLTAVLPGPSPSLLLLCLLLLRLHFSGLLPPYVWAPATPPSACLPPC